MTESKNYKKKVGDFGQKLAKRYLLAKNHDILAENYYIRGGEIDIITRFKEKIVFVEVKTRTSTRFGRPEDAVNSFKIKALVRAAESYLREKKMIDEVEFEIAVISIRIDKNNQRVFIKYFPDIQII